jgi:hypothetical protein
MFQTTDPTTNAVTGTPNTPVDIPAGQSQTFVIALTPTSSFAPTVVEFNFSGTNTAPAATLARVNTLLLSASLTPVPDIVAVAVTDSGDGTLNASVSGEVAMARATVAGDLPSLNYKGVFTVALANLGLAGDRITVETTTNGASLPLSITVREINPMTAAIIGDNSRVISPGQTATFGIFVTATGAIPFDPAARRIFLEFRDSIGVVRGSTSVAITTRLGELIAKGAELFFNEKFDGNGRTCGTCHPADNNLTIDRAFVATLPPDDPLFVAESNPALAELENTRLLREFGLILENVDGFDKPGVMRGVPHTLALSTSVNSIAGPRTGWSGDGAPGDGSLRSFATGAVIQHFPKTLNREPGQDFRMPTEVELDAMEAFQLALGRKSDISLPLPLKGVGATVGQAIFLDNSLGKCNLCHVNAGAGVNLGGGNLGNVNFDTGVEDLPNQPARLTGEPNPLDGGFGRNPRPFPLGGFGDGTFSPPPLVEAADTPPFFHNNSIETIEDAVDFYNTPAFNNSVAAREIGGGINLDPTQVAAVAAFLRVINSLENIRSALHFQENALAPTDPILAQRLLELAAKELRDAIIVLEGGGLHPDAVAVLDEARSLTIQQRTQEAIAKTLQGRGLLRDP